MENHKGSFCPYTAIFCQEGYCSGCEITRVLRLEDEAKTVFKLIALKAKYEGDKTLKELI